MFFFHVCVFSVYFGRKDSYVMAINNKIQGIRSLCVFMYVCMYVHTYPFDPKCALDGFGVFLICIVGERLYVTAINKQKRNVFAHGRHSSILSTRNLDEVVLILMREDSL